MEMITEFLGNVLVAWFLAIMVLWIARWAAQSFKHKE